MACQINEDCLREVAAVIGGVGIASQVIDKIKNNVKLYCNGNFNEDAILNTAASGMVKQVQGGIDSVGELAKTCLLQNKLNIRAWKNSLLKGCQGGLNGLEATIKSILAPHYNEGIISTICGPNGISAIGNCFNLFESACLAPLAPWTTGKCIAEAGFTQGTLFVPYWQGIPFPVPDEGAVYTINPDKKKEVYAACYGLNLHWEFEFDEQFPCRGEIKWTLRINGLDGPDGLLVDDFELFFSNEQANEAIIQIANQVKGKAKGILRKAYSLVFAELNIAYNNQLQFLKNLKGAIADGTADAIGPLVQAVLDRAKAGCPTVPCIQKAIEEWNRVGKGANTDDCFEKLRKTLIPFDPKPNPPIE